MTVNWQGIGALALTCTALGFLLGILIMAIRQDRRDAREAAAEIDRYESRLEANRRGRHARTQPRAGLPPVAPPPRQPDRSALVRSDSWHDVWCEPLGATPTAPAHVAAEHIDVMQLPPPAPAPDLNGAADTGRLPALGQLTDTGAFQAITDWGDQMQVAIETGTL